MWRRWATPQCQRRVIHTSPASSQRFPKVIDIEDATCYRRHPAPDDTPESNPPLFPKLSFRLYKDKVPYGSLAGQEEHWAILSPSSLARTTLLQILGGQHICIPPIARSYPALSEISKSPQHAIRYVGFDAERGSSVGGSNVRGAYLSARYESRREETDYSLMDYLTGHTELNALEHALSGTDKAVLDEAIQKLNLQSLLTMPVANLSNGQTRRARIAKALMARPEVLLLDGPYMGLDPNTLSKLDAVLYDLAERQSPRLVLSLRPEDGVPDWITHLVVTDDTLQVLQQGPKNNLFEKSTNSTSNRTSHQILRAACQPHSTTTTLSKDAFPHTSPPSPPGEPLVELSGVKVSYGSKTVLGDWQQPEQSTPGLHWTLHRGQRAGIFGPNGSGKTTLLSLLTSDHPQTYALSIKHFGRSRLPDPSSNESGISLFDIQRRIGHSSPEIHAFFPKNLSIRRAIESAWSDAPLAKPHLTADADRRVDAILRWFAADLDPTSSPSSEQNLIPTLEVTYHKQSHHQTKPTTRLEAAQTYHDDNFHSDADLLWADSTPFRTLPFSSQRLVLFLRSIVHSPDLVILDEAFSGMDEDVRDKALLFLSHGETIKAVEEGKAVESVLRKLGKVTLTGLNAEQGLVVISHSKEDVPGCVKEWICLPEPGEGRTPRMGRLKGPLELMREGWGEIWGRGI